MRRRYLVGWDRLCRQAGRQAGGQAGTYRRMARRRWPGRVMGTKICAEVRRWRAAPEM